MIALEWNFCRQCGAERDELWPTREVSAEFESHATSVLVSEPAPPIDELPGDPEISWGVGGALLVFLASMMVTTVVAVILAAKYGADPTAADTDRVTVITLLANQASLVGAAYFWVRYLKGSMRAFGFRTPTMRTVKLGIGVGAAGVVLSSMTAAVIGWVVELINGAPPASPEQIRLEATPTFTILLLLGLSTIILAPIAEEVFFRGMLHQAIRKRLTFVPGVVLSSFVFAIVHVIPIVIPSIFVLAILLAVFYERERNLWVPVIAHTTFNVVGYVFSFLV